MSFSVVLYSIIDWRRMNVIYVLYYSRVKPNNDVLMLSEDCDWHVALFLSLV